MRRPSRTEQSESGFRHRSQCRRRLYVLALRSMCVVRASVPEIAEVRLARARVMAEAENFILILVSDVEKGKSEFEAW